jgi:homoserine O-succinyltransferase
MHEQKEVAYTQESLELAPVAPEPRRVAHTVWPIGARSAAEESDTRTAAVDSPEPADGAIRIALLNLMPTKQETELQFSALLRHPLAPVTITLLTTETYTPTHVAQSDLAARYKTIGQVERQRFDGLIVTGAPVERLPFEHVDYWAELTHILSWSRAAVGWRLYICWGAQSALYHRFGIGKTLSPCKLFGVFEQQVLRPDAAVLEGFPAAFPAPVSRHTGVDEGELAAAGLDVLARSDQTGPCLMQGDSGRDIYMMNHLEYAAHTLSAEYSRDRERGVPVQLPANYFTDDDPGKPPREIWRPFGQLFFRNWLAMTLTSCVRQVPRI